MTAPKSRKPYRLLTIPLAVLAAGMGCSDSTKLPQTVESTRGTNPTRYAFEIWEEPLVDGMGSHAIIILRDRERQSLLYIEGLATDRKDYEVRSVGNASRDNIQAYVSGNARVENKIQSHATVFETNSGMEMTTRLRAMLIAAERINKGKYAYQLFSNSTIAGRTAYNSNATAYTLARAARLDVSHVRFSGFAPGWEQVIPGAADVSFAAIRRSLNRQTISRIALDTAKSAGSLKRANIPKKDSLDEDIMLDFDVYNDVKSFMEGADLKDYAKLSTCRTLTRPDGESLTADDVIDEFKDRSSQPTFNTHGISYRPIVTNWVVRDPASGKKCKFTL